MSRIVRALALCLALLPLSAGAQQFNTIPSGTVIGRTAIGTGPAQPIPISQLFNSLLTGPLSVPSVNTNSVIYKGSSSGQATLGAQAIAGTPAILLPNTSGTLADNATAPIVLNATTGNISCPSCLTVANATPVLSSRAFALTQNLSTLAAVRTLGYAAGGDGGGATFKNVGTAPFIDSYITGFSITPGSGYTNGTYYGVIFQTGSKPFSVGVVVISSGAVASVDISYTPGNQCSTTDVLTIVGNAPPGGSNASITVTSCSTPLASFTDSVGTHFQFVPDGFPNVLQFSAKGDWNGTDGSATDNFSAFQAASWFAGFKSSTSFDSGGYWGGRVIVPSGSFMLCGTGLKSFIVQQGVSFEGPNPAGAATIRMCDAFNSTVHFSELCDPNWHFACMGSAFRNIDLYASRNVTAGLSIAMVHSNATQDTGGLYGVYIYSGGRSCTFFEKGYGGAANVTFENVHCHPSGGVSQPAMKFGNSVASGLNYGTTMIKLNTVDVNGASSAPYHQGPGIVLNGGFYSIENMHCEETANCLYVQIPSSTGNGDIVRVHNINGGSSGGAPACTGVIVLDGTNNAGNLIVGQVPAGSCAHVVQNGQSLGTSRDTAITTDVTFNP
ncbi:hypothetical protein JIR23_21185 [Bradyrhizobium diazoefficiens]|nr:hypothetical protein [Bradyrhizobium diazoefficiens]QQN62115.1 hypothetical protein JIR23_21185 [Bradyrhizobium diazoefficiens]